MRLNGVVQGCCPSSGELSKALAPLFRSLPQVHLIHDDLIVATKTQREHREVLDKVLHVIENSGMTLNLNKCLFEKDEIPFWGLIVSKDGLKPDPKKVSSLKAASAPTNKAELSSINQCTCRCKRHTRSAWSGQTEAKAQPAFINQIIL